MLPATVFHNVEIDVNHAWTQPLLATAPGDVVTATHDLTHTDGYIVGQFAVQHDLYLGAASSGGTGLITVDGTGAQQYAMAPGAARTCRVEVNKPSGSFTPMAGTTDFSAQSFSLLAGDFTAPSGELNVGGTWNTSQTLFNHGGGTFAHNNGTLHIKPYNNTGPMLTWTIDVIPTTLLNDVTVDINHGWTMPIGQIPSGDTLHVAGDLVLVDGRLSGGVLEAHGMVSIMPTYNGGNSQLLFAGIGLQQMDATGAAGNYNGPIKLAKPSGNVLLLSPLMMDGAGQSLLFHKGDLITDATNLLTLGDDVTASGASDSSFVDGPMRKVGNEAFWFPVGAEDTLYAPLRVGATGSTSNAYTVEYFHVDPDLASYDVTQKDATLDHLSRCEYWSVERSAGTGNTTVAPSWAARSCGVTDLSALRVARWDGSTWRDHGNGGTSGNLSAGSVLSAGTISSFTIFTLGSGNANNPLPVELLSFDAIAQPGHVDLKWVTASEQDNQEFIVERSADAASFEAVLHVPGAGNSSSLLAYADIDPDPLQGTSYYRLRQVDIDGVSTLSNVVAVHYDPAMDLGLTVYPNPTSGQGTWLMLPAGGVAGQYSLEVRDAAGRLVASRTQAMTGLETSLELPSMDGIAPGTYTVHLQGDAAGRSARFILQ